ncbi:hypothetical protein Tco_1081894 [Tanacetum coccineum]|uniref:Uncharacterized protein n=1 Tax=Tanacetum coccineum TaxID=301880 RepID=A0ABQ5HZR1_9ASTR
MHFVENRIVYISEQIVCDFHRMVEMCLCDVDRMAAMGIWFDRMAAMGMWFDRMAVMSNGFNSGKCCHIVGVGCRMMVVHFLEFLDHVATCVYRRLSDKWFIALITSVSRLPTFATMYNSWLLTL